MIHNLRLFVLKNLTDILYTVGAVCIITILIIDIVLLVFTYEQSQRNEEMLKGLTCVLLIIPEDRTEGNVRECIEKNDNEAKNFEFQSVEDVLLDSKEEENKVQFKTSPEQSTPEAETFNYPASPITVPNSQPIDPPPKSEPTKQTAPKNTEQKSVKQPEPELETRTREDGVREYRYKGDTAWMICDERCEE